MKLLKAKECVDNLAPNNAHVRLTYSVTYVRGVPEVECQIYVDPRIMVTEPTWEMALLELEYILHPEQKPIPEVEDL